MRTATPSFIHELPLRTTPHDAAVLEVRLDAARNLYNACLQEALRRLDLMRESKAYQGRTEAFQRQGAHPGVRWLLRDARLL